MSRSIIPDSEIVTATEVTAGNVGDAVVATSLLTDVLNEATPASDGPVEVYGDSSYGTADMVEHIEGAGAEANVKVQAASPPREGLFSQDAFEIDTTQGTVRCPNGVLVQIRLHKEGFEQANFASHCTRCALREKCTLSASGRSIRIHPKHPTIRKARLRQQDPQWKTRYRATRPKVERKLAHLMRRRHGGRRARVRGQERVARDFALLGAAVNLQRLAVLGVHFHAQRRIRGVEA